MADKIREEIELVLDERGFTKKAKDSGDALEKMFSRAAIKAVAFNKVLDLGQQALSFLVAEMKQGVQSALEYERTTQRLGNALRGAGLDASSLLAGFEAQAATLQRLTGINDEAIRGHQALAISMGVGVEKVDEFVRASISMANATGKSADEAVRQLAKTMGGYAGELGEILPEVKELTQEQLRNGDAIDLINEKFGEQLDLMTKGTAGSVTGLTNAWGDLTEAIAKAGAVSLEASGFLKSLEDELSGIALVFEKKGFMDGLRSLMGGDTLQAEARIIANDEARASIIEQRLQSQDQTNRASDAPKSKTRKPRKTKDIAPLLASGPSVGDLQLEGSFAELGPMGAGAEAALEYQQSIADAGLQIWLSNEQRKEEILQREAERKKKHLTEVAEYEKKVLQERLEEQKMFVGIGTNIVGGLANTFVDAFATMAAGGKVHMGDLMKQFLIATGRMLLGRGISTFLSSLWPVNPQGLAVGAAQIAAGGAMMAGSLAIPSKAGGGRESGSASAAAGNPNAGFVGGGSGGFNRGPDRRDDLRDKPVEVVIVVDGPDEMTRMMQLEKAKKGLRQRGIL